jgi:hypothetical protein
MNNYLLASLLGVAGWVIGYAAGIPLLAAPGYMHTAETVVGIFFGMIFAVWYFQRSGSPGTYMREGLVLGAIWLVIMVVLDIAFLAPFIQGGLGEWFSSIGLGYLGIPVMTTLFGWGLDRIRR